MTVTQAHHHAMVEVETQFDRLQNMLDALNIVFDPEIFAIIDDNKRKISATFGVIDTLNEIMPKMLAALEDVRAIERDICS